MTSLDTRLHKVEARVAALEAEQAALSNDMAELQGARDDGAGGPEVAGETVAVTGRAADQGAPQQRDSRPAPAQAAQPAPQQPLTVAEQEALYLEGVLPDPDSEEYINNLEMRLKRQPRGGGGAL